MKNRDSVEHSCTLAWENIFDSTEQAYRAMHTLLGMRLAFVDANDLEAHEYIDTLFQLSQYIVVNWNANKQEWWNEQANQQF